MNFELEVDTEVLEHLRRKVPELYRQATLKTGQEVERRAVLLLGKGKLYQAYDTGHLRENSIGTRVIKKGADYVAEVYSTADYAEFVHEGTGIYGPLKRLITPKTKKALKFVYKGKEIVVKSVKGMRPRPFFRQAVKYVVPKRMKEIFERVAKVVLIK